MHLTRRNLVHSAALGGPLALIGIGGRSASAASDAAEIDRDATNALNRLYHFDRRAAGLRSKASGILIFPRIVKAGFIFGAQGGKGALRVGGHTRGYYTIAAASFGLQAGVQWFSYVMFFMNQNALRYLDQSDGWAVGTDPNVVVIDRGVGTTLNSTTLAKDVIAFPFGQQGLMADLSLQGSKITTYNPNA
jgi:lipid-binding SYLF domain-containing protein